MLEARKPKPLVCIMEIQGVIQGVSLKAETTDRREEGGRVKETGGRER